ncbi:LysR substrate binding domain [Mycobacteroides abscessus subsp. abscessus]|nr:LysR substrate binding domain [Mycobacteroides abscessus subsp. abscessus]
MPALCSNSASAVYDFVASSDAITLSGLVAVSHRIAAGTLAAVPVRERGMAQRDIEIQTLAGRTLPRLIQEFADFLAERLAPLA